MLRKLCTNNEFTEELLTVGKEYEQEKLCGFDARKAKIVNI